MSWDQRAIVVCSLAIAFVCGVWLSQRGSKWLLRLRRPRPGELAKFKRRLELAFGGDVEWEEDGLGVGKWIRRNFGR